MERLEDGASGAGRHRCPMRVVLAGVVWVVLWKATGNAFYWPIHIFGNEGAAGEIEEKWRNRQERDTKQ